MKKTVLLMGSSVLLLSIAFVSCKKESMENPASIQSLATNDNPQRSELVVDFNYKLYQLTNNNGSTDYKCLSPKDDCSKVRSKKTIIRDDQEAALDAAIVNDTVHAFFAFQSNWNELLPHLLEETGWKDDLKDGVVTLVKKKDVIDQGILYLAYDPQLNPDSLTAGDVSFALGITDAE
jgi:hypothetical protein